MFESVNFELNGLSTKNVMSVGDYRNNGQITSNSLLPVDLIVSTPGEMVLRKIVSTYRCTTSMGDKKDL